MSHDVNLFSRLYIASQARAVDMDNLFAYENHAWPPFLSSDGRLYSLKNPTWWIASKLLCLFMKMHPMWMPKYGWRGCSHALVHSLDPKMATERIRTFQSNTEKVFLPAIMRILEPVLWLDVIWDRYLEISLKTQAREDHGSGALMKVDKDVWTPCKLAKHSAKCSKQRQPIQASCQYNCSECLETY